MNRKSFSRICWSYKANGDINGQLVRISCSNCKVSGNLWKGTIKFVRSLQTLTELRQVSGNIWKGTAKFVRSLQTLTEWRQVSGNVWKGTGMLRNHVQPPASTYNMRGNTHRINIGTVNDTHYFVSCSLMSLTAVHIRTARSSIASLLGDHLHLQPLIMYYPDFITSVIHKTGNSH